MTIRRLANAALAPVVGAAFIALWIVAEAARWPDVPVMVLFGLALGLTRLVPLLALALGLVGEAVSAVGLLLPRGSWIHPPTDTDWPMYLAVLAVPAIVVAHSTRRTLRPSLVATLLGSVSLAALMAASPSLSWATGSATRWLGYWNATETCKSFVTFALIISVFGSALWLVGWGIAGFVRFLSALTRDPLIRIRLHDALSLGPVEEDQPSLTSRERDVLLLVADGMSNAQIATALFLSEATVKTHLRNLLMKLKLRSRTEVVAFAWRTGLVRLDN